MCNFLRNFDRFYLHKIPITSYQVLKSNDAQTIIEFILASNRSILIRKQT